MITLLRMMGMAALFLICGSGWAIEPDWTDYAKILKDFVRPGTKNGVPLQLVDYPALKANGKIEKIVARLAQFDPGMLQTREERLAFYINAYNILAIQMVIDHFPLESIKDAGSLLFPVWKNKAGQINGQAVTLHEIEHKILRPMGEPGIHMAIVCASVSCPDLRAEPYTAARLNEQLDDQASTFLNNRAKGLQVDNQGIRVSQIFDWFEEDFQPTGGLEQFLRRYRDDLPPQLLIVAYLPYDWSLNSTSGTLE